MRYGKSGFEIAILKMSIQFRLVDEHGLKPYVVGLRKLEREISYPIADGADSFVIDHGVNYHPFFSKMGKKHIFWSFLRRERLLAVRWESGNRVLFSDNPIPDFILLI